MSTDIPGAVAGGEGLSSPADAVDAMANIDLDAAENLTETIDDRNRNDQGQFQKTEIKQEPKTEAKTEAAAEDADDADDEEFFEWEMPAEEDGGEPVVQRVKTSEMLERYQRAAELETELENVKSVTPPPPDYDQAINQTMAQAQQYYQGLQMVEQMLQPQAPNTQLLDEMSEHYNPGLYHEQLRYAQQQQTQLGQVHAEMQRVSGEAIQQSQAVQQAGFAREQRKLMEIWPELKQETQQRHVTESVSKFYGIDKDTLDGVHDSRFYAVLKDALAYRSGQAESATAVRQVKAKPRLVKGKASSGKSNKQRARAQSLERLQQSGSLNDARDALDGLI